jgi:outer membrane protein OmpA-like peptidoglycan-associated protein
MKTILHSFFILFATVAYGQFWDFTEPKRMEGTVNSSAEESMPVFSPNGRELYFMRTFDEANYGGPNDQDIWASVKNNKGNWQEAENIAELNARFHNGVVALRNNGNRAYILYSEGITQSNKSLAIVERVPEERWQTPKKINIPGLQFKGQFVGFAISEDEKVIIVSINGEKSKGLEDLYYTLNVNGNWSPLKHMGEVLNSNGYEISPFLSSENDTLYFASNGHGGEGGCDIFYSVRKGEWDEWSKPVNMGPKINSPKFDAYMVLKEGKFYWSSNRATEDADFYWSEPLYPAKLLIQETHNHVTAFSGSDGSIDVKVTSGVAPFSFKWNNGFQTEDLSNLKRGIYSVTVSDAINQTATLTIEITEPQPVVQKVLQLPEVRYAVNSWVFVNDTTIQSKDSLDRVAQLLQEYPGMMLELISHTDSRGDDKKNLLLSVNRAKAVYKYLVEERGIDPRRLIPVGKGELEPSRIFDETSGSYIELTESYINQFKTTDKTKFEQLHQINRRTEGKIIGLNFDPSTAPDAPKEYLQFKVK